VRVPLERIASRASTPPAEARPGRHQGELSDRGKATAQRQLDMNSGMRAEVGGRCSERGSARDWRRGGGMRGGDGACGSDRGS
jgi:hypothetical protein